jgi:hypothetical protein
MGMGVAWMEAIILGIIILMLGGVGSAAFSENR